MDRSETEKLSRLDSVTVLTISREFHDEIIAHARRDHPDEACGVIAGAIGSDLPTRFIPMLNAAMSPTFYEFDSGDLLRRIPRVLTSTWRPNRAPIMCWCPPETARMRQVTSSFVRIG